MISMEGFVEHVQPWLPDFVVRVVVWLYLRYFVGRIRNLDHPFKELRTVNRIKAEANEKFAPVADKTDAANEQHYEVPTEFFVNHLGPCRKYSSCEWTGCSTLAQAEAKTFDSYLEKMGIGDVPTDGTGRVLEVGNGWGSFLLYAAAKHPTITFTGFSNSSTQQAHIMSEAAKRGLGNVTSLRLDINDFCEHGLPSGAGVEVVATAGGGGEGVGGFGGRAEALPLDYSALTFDRIFSCECLEHSKNYAKIFEALAKVLKDGGKVFVQILCHREYTYFMNGDDWMGRNFFTGGTIPSTKLFMFFTEHLVVEDAWYLPGTLYARTLDAWLHAMEAAKGKITAVFARHGYKRPAYEYQKWRMFYLMSSVSFGFNGGNEWMVAYYTFTKRHRGLHKP